MEARISSISCCSKNFLLSAAGSLVNGQSTTEITSTRTITFHTPGPEYVGRDTARLGKKKYYRQPHPAGNPSHSDPGQAKPSFARIKLFCDRSGAVAAVTSCAGLLRRAGSVLLSLRSSARTELHVQHDSSRGDCGPFSEENEGGGEPYFLYQICNILATMPSGG